MTPAIHIDNVGKRYFLGRQAHRAYRTLRESLVEMAAAPWRRLRRRLDQKPGEFWALQDVTFQVQAGEVVGIIGRNGAGKSTLLKILSQITRPSRGRVTIDGRVGSLLEVGTGFHPELTGRENVFLNGSILGMSRREIARKFDDIVAFAEVEQFLDTPVKRYSSGMYVRLAFSVAAHLEPEVLIIDEVLAVGDASFQKKCLHKMEDVGKQGRTVLFVSHNMQAVARLCQRAILLEQGAIVADGPSDIVSARYLRGENGSSAHRVWQGNARAPGDEIARLHSVRVVTPAGDLCESLDIRQSVGLEMTWETLLPNHWLVPNFHVYFEDGSCVFVSPECDPEWASRTRPQGIYKSTAWIPGNFLAEGTYFVGAAVSTMDPVEVHFYERDAVAFHVLDRLEGDSVRRNYAGPYPGVVRPMLQWTNEATFAS
jgi:lipopolysaccharide transport system ATP-binding protein